MMEQIVNYDMIALARESRGLTQSELSSLLKISQGKISKIEQGILTASDELINELSQILNYPNDFFYSENKIYPGLSYHRKRMSLSAKLLNGINAKINIRVIHIRKLLKSVEFLNNNIPFWDIEEHLNPKEIAEKLRLYWGIPKGPISNLVELIESNGGIVIMFDFQTNKIDGLSLVVEDLPPIIYLNNVIPGDRLRFTLAHELGHIIMHKYPSDTMEKEADLFASEFLMPKDDIKFQLENLDFYKLAELKRYWKVSMASLIMRASLLELLTPSKKQSLWFQLSKSGYKTKEPIEIPKEQPSLINEIINLYSNDLNYSNVEISNLLLLNIDEFLEIYREQGKIIRLYPNK